jgi:hypothetical protein
MYTKYIIQEQAFFVGAGARVWLFVGRGKWCKLEKTINGLRVAEAQPAGREEG